MCLQEQLAEIILRAMDGEARKRLFSLFADDKDAGGGEIEQLEKERDAPRCSSRANAGGRATCAELDISFRHIV